ncbi:trigger factor [Tellurirhabdus rosea]|uniref:trigger factor n=1 Tax=Tellurirhabdus rosea TaxID=2674997 RepID=UPI002254328D|nr:trigger factor [Tellurirhabdus rosea]
MEIALEKSTETNASLTIKLTKEDYQPEVNKKLKEYSKKVSIKGFRPGHVPASLVQKMYGKSLMVDEINNLLSKTISNYIRENKLQVVGDPLPDRDKAQAIDWDNQTDFEFVYNLGLASDFDVDFASLPALSSYTIEAGDKELEETIENLRKQFHGHAHAEVSEEGDMLYGELKQVSGVAEGAEPFETKTALPTAQIQADALPQFVGVNKGDTITFDIRQAFADDKAIAHATGLKAEEAANLSGEFSFVVDDITRNEPAEVNQEFFDKVLGKEAVETEEQFRAKVLEIIQTNYKRETDALLRLDIEKSLMENINIALPDEFLKEWLLTTNEGKVSTQEVDEQYEQFSRSVKLQLIKNKVAEQNEIKVEFADVLEATKGLVREQFGFYGENEQMDQTVDRIAQNYLMDEKQENYSKMFNRVFDDKVLQLIESKVTIEPKTITLDEFKTLAQGVGVQA